MGRNDSDCDSLTVLFSFTACLVPVARRNIFDKTPTFLNVVFGDTVSPTQRITSRVSLSTVQSIHQRLECCKIDLGWNQLNHNTLRSW